jgi:1,4-dihydroxy-2-naphthoate octaprenyltransferase
MAVRPRTLYAAIAPVLAGGAVAFAQGGFKPLPALAALLVAILIQVGTNLYNDVADFERGVDTTDRLGPVRVTQAGYLSPGQVKAGAYFSFALAGLAGLSLVFAAGPLVLVIGLASILAGLAYTGGPFPLSANGLGDPFVFIFFGFVAVGGTVFVQLGSVPPLGWLAGAMLGALITALLVVNNVRDLETDRAAGRRTIPARFGREVGWIEFGLLVALAYVLPVIAVTGIRETTWVMLTWVTLPHALRLVRDLRAQRGAALNRVLGATARLALCQAGLFSLGLMLGTL